MAQTEKLTFIIEAEDRAKATLQSLEGNFSGLQDKIKANAGAIAGVTATAGVAFAGISSLVMKTTGDFADAEKSALQLRHAVINVSHATEAQYEATKKLADELERKGVLDGDNISTGLAQLSTFGLSNTAVQALGGSLADLAVNQFGVTASGDQLTQSANMIAKALNGQFGVLEKSGIRFTEAQKKAIEFGSEMEKVKAINEGFAQNLKYTNDVALQGLEGQMAKANVQIGNMSESIGGALKPALMSVVQALMPLIMRITDFIAEHPKLVGAIVLIVGGLTGLVAIVGTLSLAMLAFSAVSAPVILVIGGIALAIGAIIALFIYWKDITEWLGQIFYETFEAIKAKMVEWWTTITTTINGIWNGIQEVLTAIMNGFKFAWEAIKNATISIFDFIKNYFTLWGLATKLLTLENMKAIADGIIEAWTIVKNFFVDIWNAIKGVFQSAIDYINSLIDSFMNKVNSMMSAISRVGSTIGGGISSAVSSVAGVFKRATGGNVSANTPYVVGENGQEVFVPNTNGSIFNQNQLAGMGGITINLSGNTFLGKEGIAESIGDELVKILRLNTKI